MKSKVIILYILSFVVFDFISAFSADLNLEFSHRRCFDEIHLEVWLRSVPNYSPNIGYGNFRLKYDTTFLSVMTGYISSTDTIDANIDQTNPVIDITSPINSSNNLNEPKIIEYSKGFIEINFSKNRTIAKGFQPSSDGKGTFLFSVPFKIKSNTNYSSVTGIDWVKDSSRIFDTDSTDLSTKLAVITEKQFKILGITILSPKLQNSVIDRDKNYQSLTGSYLGKGYPIYFERSVNPSEYKVAADKPPVIDRNLGYVLEYTDESSIWKEYGRFNESDNAGSSVIDNKLYYTGEISNPGTVSSYIVTTQKGSQLTKTNFRQPLRVLIKKDVQYKLRLDKTSIKITQLKGQFGTLLTSWTKDSVQFQPAAAFISGRIFSVHLNGTNEYFKTENNISNSTQLTVEAWINLSAVKSGNGEPAIVASSAGEDAAPVNGSKEGSWMLYLKAGKYPAFRAREIENRGNKGYLADLVSHYPITALESSKLFTHDYDRNWNHIAATVNNNIVKLYLNGELVDEFVNDSALDARMLVTNHPVWIGVNPNDKIDANDHLQGAIKGFRLWRVALNQDEIRQYASGLVNPANTSVFDDIRRGLELYYNFGGDLSDAANDVNYQSGNQIIDFYKAKVKNNYLVNFKPDNPHLKITSPASKTGLLNTQKAIYEVRWLSFEIGDITKTNTRDVELEYSIDGGLSWFGIKDSLARLQSGNTAPDAEKTLTNWEPYQNNEFTANLRNIDPFNKRVLLRISGTTPNNQKDYYYISDTISIAPYFSLFKGVNSVVYIPAERTLNLDKSHNLIELWIKPYRFPNTSEANFPLVSKVDTVSGKEHFSLKMLPTGQLQFNITNKEGKIKSAYSDINKPIIQPNSVAVDTPWTHIAVFYDLKYKDTSTYVRFYIDGNPQNSSVINNQLGNQLKYEEYENYPVFIGSYPKVKSGKSSSFLGEIREFRFWSGLPKVFDPNNDIDSLSLFIQGASPVRSAKLKPEFKQNLTAALSFNGGTYHYLGRNRIIKSDDFPEIYAVFMNEDPEFVPAVPYIKLAEPIYKQRVNNKNTDLKIRWTGFDFSSTDFFIGSSGTPPFIEYSLLGGGGNETQPYKYVGSLYWNGNKVNSLTIPDNPSYIFKGTGENTTFAASLNVSMANPDKDNNGQYTDQGALPAALTNARLRISSKYRVFTSVRNISAEGALFTITPGSNFTLRIIPEGYHDGRGNKIRQIGSDYNSGGIKIKIFDDENGKIGKLIDSAESFYGFSDLDPLNMRLGNNKFANIDFVFNNLLKTKYWVLAEHHNHLPVLSRFAAPYQFEGDNPDTWKIESGWDFLSWNGVKNNFLPSQSSDPYTGLYFTAYGEASSNKSDTIYKTTQLSYSGGSNGIDTSLYLAGMVAGDIVKNNIIDAEDAAYLRKNEASLNVKADLTGDLFVNADDRILLERNLGRKSNIDQIGLPGGIEPPVPSVNNEINGNNNQTLSEFTPLIKLADDFLLANEQVRIYFESEIKSNVIDINISMEALSQPFELGSSTIAFEFDTNVVRFKTFSTKSDVPYGLSKNGYKPIRSAPDKAAELPLKNVRTIEIDYDKTSGKPGALLPNAKTYIATLRFDILNSRTIKFNWHNSTSINSTNNKITDDNVKKDTILPKYQYTLKLTSPNGGEEFRPGIIIPVKWTFSGKSDINLEYTSNGGITWLRINTNPVSITTGSFNWTVAPVYSNMYMIRILDNESGMEVDRSDSTFSVISGFAYFIKPSSGDGVFMGGTQSQLIWVSGGYNEVSFDFSSDGGQTWKKFINKTSATAGTAFWTIPKVVTKNAIVRMIDIQTGDTITDSDPFRILGGTLTFQRPKDGEKVYVNRTFNIRWVSADVDSFDLQVSYDNGNLWDNLSVNQKAADGLYKWLVPAKETDFAIVRAIWKGDYELEFGRSGTFIITILDNVDYDELSRNGLEIFPQPANNFLILKAEDSFNLKKVCIYDINGRILYENSNKSSVYNINTENYPTGIYIIEFHTLTERFRYNISIIH